MAQKEIGWFATREEANAEIRRMISAGKGAAVMSVEERQSRPVDSAAVAAGIVPASGTPVYYIVTR